jgi:4-diphosphocytidyl-2-C-methyl-D-erythritol kinase
MLTPAKINLYLNILGKRSDGYHLLDTLIAFTDICDEINITASDIFSFEVSGEFASLVENDEHNIVIRAYRLMQQACGVNNNIAIKLIKNIPVGAGLGGGSSDAAATLMYLNEMWKAGLSKEKLSEIGLKLGADVPIFINQHAAFVSGIGEKIENTQNLPELYAILVYPNKPISTKDVFTSLAMPAGNTTNSIKAPYAANELTMHEWLIFLKSKDNDLDNAAINILPEIKDIIIALSHLDGCEFARMSGSGSTCFAIFSDKNKAEKALIEINTKNAYFWIKLAKIMETTA